MSLAVTTTKFLTIIDGASLKRNATSYDFRKTPMLAIPKAHVWSMDNSTLYLISSDTIHSFSPTSCTFTSLYKSPQGSPLQAVLAMKDKSTILFAQGSAIYLLAVGSSTAQITSSLIGHSAPVTSLSVSNDGSLLASSSASGTLCVHNFAHNSLTVLKGIPTTPGSSSRALICTFHPHMRTRLLLGCGKTLVVYDTTRPSSPLKSILLSEKEGTGTIPNIGNIVAISCSPFSKTLTAVAFNSGLIALVDLEKDRPFFKSLQLEVPLTSLTFTADGTSLAVGTEHGKIIIQDLRAMEHDHRTLSACDEGREERIIGVSIQRRIKTPPSPSSGATSKPTAAVAKFPASLSAPLSQYDLNNNSGAIVKPSTRRIVSSSPSTKPRIKPVTPIENRRTKDEPPKRTCLFPEMAATDDGGEKLCINKDGKKKATAEKNHRSTSTSLSSESRSTSATRAASSGSKTRPSLKTTTHDRPSSRLSVASRTGSAKMSSATPISPASRANSKVSNATSSDKVVGPSAGYSARNRRASEDGSQSTFQQALGSAPTISSQHNRPASRTSTIHLSRTPTPDLPPVDEETPLAWRDAVKKLNVAFESPGVLTTPTIETWAEAGDTAKTTGKHVEWADSGRSSTREPEGEAEIDEGQLTVFAAYKGTSQVDIQSTSSHPGALNVSSPLRRPHIPLNALQTSPLRVGAEGTNLTENKCPQESLRAVVKDVMYEYRQETREDIKGLHLDLLRMGRSWKTELRSLMDEYIGGLRELMEENVKLRKENEKLRQGF